MTPADLLRAPVAAKQPTRYMLDVQIDDAQLRLLTAETPELRVYWAERFTTLVRDRNAARSTAEIEELDRARGLR